MMLRPSIFRVCRKSLRAPYACYVFMYFFFLAWSKSFSETMEALQSWFRISSSWFFVLLEIFLGDWTLLAHNVSKFAVYTLETR